MRHRIYTGPFAALEAQWLAEIARIQQGDPLAPVSVLVGSNVLASYLKGRIAEQGRGAANLRFYTFVDLARRLATACERRGRRPRLPHLGASVILEDILASWVPSVFEPVSGYAGFRGAMLDTFRDLRDAGISPEEVERGVGALIRLAPDRKEHLLGVADVYRRFRARIERFHDVDDDFRDAARNARRAREILSSPHLLVYGIYDVTGQQADLLSGLKDGLEMLCFIPYVNEDVSGFARPFIETRARELRVEVQALAVEPADSSLGRLWRLGFGWSREALGPRGGKDVSHDGSFALVSAPGESRAAVEIVREILRAVKDEMIDGFHEAAVIMRQPQEEIPILAEALRLRGLPYFVHGGSSFAERPLSKAVLAIATLESSSFSRQAILAAMELVSAALPAEVASAWNVPEWRALTNDARFLAGIESWESGTEALVRAAREHLEEAQDRTTLPAALEEREGRTPSVTLLERRLASAQALRAGWQSLRLASEAWPGRLSWSEWASFLEERFEPLFGDSEDWSLFSAALDEIGSLEPVGGIGGPAALVSRATLTAALTESVSTLAYPAGRFQRSGVNLFSVGAARGLRFPLVIVAGLEEGRFPARLRQDPLLFDTERLRIGSPPRLPLKSQRTEEEKLLFDMAVRSAQRRLVLVTSRLDEGSDRERIPSEFFLRATSAACEGPVTLRDLAEGTIPGFRSISLENPAPAKGQIAVDEGEIRLRLITGGPMGRYVARDALAEFERDLMGGPLAYDRARWLKRLTEFDGRLTDPDLLGWLVRKVGPAAGQVSASRIEEYAKCPYLFYLRRVMELEPWEELEPAEGVDPLERGLIIHEILERFLRSLHPGEFSSASVEALQQLLMVNARDALERNRPAGILNLLWEIERDTLLEALAEWLAFEKKRMGQGLLPACFEHPFGKFFEHEEFPPFPVLAGKHEFVFRGRIDRIDLSADGKWVRVIDYKTGRLPKTMAGKGKTPLMGGEKIQIAIYRGALLANPRFRGVQSVEGEYLHLETEDRKIASCSITDDALSEASQQLPEVLEIIGDGIERGAFFTRTSSNVRPSGHCDYCDYLAICGKDRKRREESKSTDYLVQRFIQIKEKDRAREEEA